MSYDPPVPGAVLCGFQCHVTAGRTGGNDYPVPTGTPVHAIDGGIVTQAMDHSLTAGVYVEINHGKLHSRYLHLSVRYKKVGDPVFVREVIGYSGSTGQSTGPHLHFDVGNAPDTAQRFDPEILFNQEDDDMQHIILVSSKNPDMTYVYDPLADKVTYLSYPGLILLEKAKSEGRLTISNTVMSAAQIDGIGKLP